MGTVLLVENNLELACAVRRDLLVSEFEVTIATTSAMARALDQTFDVGVFDLAFEEEGGIELAQELLSRERIGRAVFLTGACWQPLLRRAAEIGPWIDKDQGTLALLAELKESARRPCSRRRLAPPKP